MSLSERLATKESREKLRILQQTRNVGVKFPYKCIHCGALTDLVTEGGWKGTYHCPECDIYQEWSKWL